MAVLFIGNLITVSQDENRFLANISDSRFISKVWLVYGGAVHVFNIKTKIIQFIL